jgi:voltage-gated potassium channel
MIRQRVANALTASPLMRRVAFHAKRMTRDVDTGFFLRLSVGLVGFVLLAATAVTLIERPKKDASTFFKQLSSSFYWAITTVLGAGDSSYVGSTAGFVISWVMVLFGVANIIVCGWNPTARDLVAELNTDDYETKIVVMHTAEKNPCGAGVYYVAGDVTNEADLKRAGIEDALAAWSARPTRATSPTCARSWRSSRSNRWRRKCARSSRSTTQSTSSASVGPGPTRFW